MTAITQTSQFHALKRVLWFMEKRKMNYVDDNLFPGNSYNILKKYVEDQEKQADIAYRKELIISEQGLHASNVPAGHTGE